MTRLNRTPQNLKSWFGRTLNDYCHREGGVAAPIISLSLVAIIGMGALALDVGRAYGVQRWLQNSADSAALAGAEYIDDNSGASTTPGMTTLDLHSAAAVTQFSASTGGWNLKSDIPVTTTAALECLKLGVPCNGKSGTIPAANAIQVQQTATVPMFFAQVLGVKTMTINAVAVAEAGGFSAQPYNIMFVLDTTASMGGADNECSISGSTQETCAQAGIKLFLQKMNPVADSIGMVTFPELANPSQAANDTTCPTSNPTIASEYTPLSNTEAVGGVDPTTIVQTPAVPKSSFETAFGSGLITTDPLAVAAGDSTQSNCSGMQTPGGLGTFYADAINQAQYILNELKTSSTSTKNQQVAQNVMILISDGDASASSSKIYTTAANGQTNASLNQCEQGFNAAANATAAGTWVFALSYGSPTTGPTTNCATDSKTETYANKTVTSPVSPANSPCYAMQNIASVPAYFFADQSAGCKSPSNPTLTDVIGLINGVANELQRPRLLASNTPASTNLTNPGF